MVWTVMIAGEAGKTFTVVHPLRLTAQSSFYVGYGTDVGTDSASDTTAAVHMKGSVGDKETFEEPSDRTRKERGYRASFQPFPSPWFPFHAAKMPSDSFGKLLQLFFRRLFLDRFALFCIYIHAGQTDIRLWHDQGTYSF